jgi:mono/diheme cytochrome c family protein
VRSAGRAVLLAAGLLLAACGPDDKAATTGGAGGGAASPAGAQVAAAGGDGARGKQVWLAQCVVCHGLDPAKDGPVGPAVKGASRELLDARVLHAAYPPGYKPKRETKVMPARPDLVATIPDLAVYLR